VELPGAKRHSTADKRAKTRKIKLVTIEGRKKEQNRKRNLKEPGQI
jgi:hypothetical protein